MKICDQYSFIRHKDFICWYWIHEDVWKEEVSFEEIFGDLEASQAGDQNTGVIMSQTRVYNSWRGTGVNVKTTVVSQVHCVLYPVCRTLSVSLVGGTHILEDVIKWANCQNIMIGSSLIVSVIGNMPSKVDPI